MNKATNAAMMRVKNEKIILSLINKMPISRVGISKITGLTKAAVTIIVDDFKKRGIVTEKNALSKNKGRNPVMLYLNPEAFYFVGVNISRSSIGVGIVDLSGKVISSEELSICPPDKAYPMIVESIDNQVVKNKIDREKIHKISVAAPGPVDSNDGVILNPPNFTDWHGASVSKELEALTSIGVILRNVSSATAISEKYFGSAHNTDSFLSLIVDEGIGSGIIVNDVLFDGPCELGHVSINYDGIKCECGNRGCLEKYASIPCILKCTEYSNWHEVVDANDTELMKREAKYISSAIISARNIFMFDTVVLCGDLTYKTDTMVNLITEQIQKRILTNDMLCVCAGEVKSKYLIAASSAIYDLFN